MIKDLSGLLDELEKVAPIFARDIREDEVKNNPSFFIYEDDGDIVRVEDSTNQYKQEFYLSFVTRNNVKLDKFHIIELCHRHKLFFESCNTQVGKIENLDSETSLTTFIFHHKQLMCRG